MKATDQSHLAPFCLFEMNGICAALTYVMMGSDINIQSYQFRSVSEEFRTFVQSRCAF